MRVLFKLLPLLMVARCFSARENIYQENGGFKGILVAIDGNVDYDATILPNLEAVLLQTSEAMYKATEYDKEHSGDPANGLTSSKHLAQVKVLVPKSWPDQPQCSDAKSETFNSADFRVVQPTAQFGEFLLHTEMENSACGQPGKYTMIADTFLKEMGTSKDLYGDDLGKAVLHEWAHLRWGLREESNNKDGGDTCTVDTDLNGKNSLIPIKCSFAVPNGPGQPKKVPGTKDQCTYEPHDNDGSNKATATIMFFNLPFYTKMYTFCDSDKGLPSGETNEVAIEMRHDADITHPHNNKCESKSGWRVLREHQDFNRTNAAPEGVPPFDFGAHLDFQCVQQRSTARIVLLMDVSGSMSGARLEQMGSDVALFLKSLPFGETEIGMVEFASTATRLVSVTPLDSNAVLTILLNAIPTSATGGTCIGCGINMAIDVLEEGGESAAGGLIMVFTDGGENEVPMIADVAPNVLLKEVIVHGLLMSGIADDHDLIKLANVTGGDVCIYEDNGNGGSDYYQCLFDLIDDVISFVIAEIKTEDLTVPSTLPVVGTVPIDSSFEDSLRFALSWTESFFLTQAQAQALEQPGGMIQTAKASYCDNLAMVITAPDGTVIDQNDPRYDYQAQFRLITVDASGFKEGEWKYRVQKSSIGMCNARLRIEGFPDTSSPDDEKQPILMTARANKININVQPGGNVQDNIVTLYVTLRQGLSPVVDAEVTAAVESGGSSQQIEFQDKGQGPDNAADDGIYSAYFYQYSGDGVYSVRAAAKGTSGQTHILRETRELQNKTYSVGYTVVRTQNLEPVAALERAAIGGAFEVKNSVPNMNTIIPPARINDLKRGVMTNDTVELTWTAVGDSMLDGTADHYEVRLCANVTDEWATCMEVDQSMLTEGDLSTPKLSGSSELIAISLDYLLPGNESSFMYYVRIKAVDQFNNMGENSNIGQIKGAVYVAPPQPPVTNPPPTPPPATVTPAPPTGTPAPGTPGPVPPPPKNINFAAIAGAVACAAVITMVTVGGAITRMKMTKAKKKQKVHPTNPEQPMETVEFEDREITFKVDSGAN